jgi:1A family penicillin-binding protein
MNIKNIFSFNNLRNSPGATKISSLKNINGAKIKTWFLRICLGFLVFMMLLSLWFAKDLPTPGKIHRHQSAAATQIFDRNGNELYTIHGDTKRIMVGYNDIPPTVIQATLTAEDRSFYHDYGINAKGVLRAAYNDIFHHTGSLAGGSTITQQFVKNALLTSQKTFTRKIKEAILAIEIETMYSKQDILTMYLNEIPYGSYAYGIEAASETFLGKKAKDLTLAESVTLTALPQSPTYYSPYGIHPDQRLARVNWILDGMVSQGYITKDQAIQAKKEAKDIKFVPQHEQISAPHFVMYVKDLLAEQYGEQTLEEGGLKVYTTLDGDKQKAAEQAVADAKLSNVNATNASLVSIDPKTGQILAMVGSRDFFNQDIDGQVNVAIANRQPGSAFKPVVYATLFKKEYSPGTTFWDVTTDFGNYTPKDYDGTTRGPVTIRKALAGSLNIPAVKSLYLAGMNNVLDQAHSMGITTLNQPDRYGLSLVLGGGEVKLLDLTTAYSVFANQGVLAPTTPFLKVVNGNGKVLQEYKENKKDVLDPSIAYEISNILSDNNARSYMFGSHSALYFSDRPVAAKTGTTQQNRDAWTMGYTPSIATGVWVGNDDNTPMTAGGAGAMAAAPIWHQYMEKVLSGTPVEQFNRPDNVKDVTIDRYSNKLPNGGETTTDIFTPWQIPTEKAQNIGAIRLDKYTGKRATDDCPDQFTETKNFLDIHSEQPDNPAWENPVRNYLASIGMLTDAPPKGEKTCAAVTNHTTVDIISPAEGDTVSGNFTIAVEVNSNVSISNVEFQIDGQSLGKATSKPYETTINANTLPAGVHRITVVATDESGVPTTAQVTINVVIQDTSPPGPATSISITPGANFLNISWKNPSDSDFSGAKIYLSTSASTLGSLNDTISGSPGGSSSTAIHGLKGKTTYYVTIRPVDSNGNENQNTTQYLGTTL